MKTFIIHLPTEESAPAGLAGPSAGIIRTVPEQSPNKSMNKGSYHVWFVLRDVLRTSGGFFGGFFVNLNGLSFHCFSDLSVAVSFFDIREQIKDILGDVPFTDKDRVMEILQAEGVSSTRGLSGNRSFRLRVVSPTVSSPTS